MKKNKTLVMTVGLPLSGKLEWAQTQGHPIVHPDSIRLALHGQSFQPLAEPFVWAIAKTMVRALFAAGHDKVVLVACNTTKDRRDDWGSEDWAREFKLFEKSGDSCRVSAAREGRDDLVPVIERMCERFEPVGVEEALS